MTLPSPNNLRPLGRGGRTFANALLGACALLAAACSEPADVAEPTNVETIPIVDENNYRATSSLSIPTIETASGQDLDICWDGLNSDIHASAEYRSHLITVLAQRAVAAALAGK